MRQAQTAKVTWYWNHWGVPELKREGKKRSGRWSPIWPQFDLDQEGSCQKRWLAADVWILFILFFSLPASVCFAVCLLSLAWALVLYARACSLIRPGHLQMTPAAILCRLLWRVGLKSVVYSYDGVGHLSITLLLSLSSCLCWQVSMLGSRFAVLMLFTRVFKQWVLGVIGRSCFIPPSFSSD